MNRLGTFRMQQATANDLHLRAREARHRLSSCDLCILDCRVDRTRGGRGICRLDDRTFWFNELLHFGIEMELLPAHAIYLTGCNMRCAYCNVMDWVAEPRHGKIWDAGWMLERVILRRRQGAQTLLFVGGEPTVNLPVIIELLTRLPEQIPICWDSNMLFSASARELLEGIVDIYIGDLKFGNNECAREFGGVLNYLETMEENLTFAHATARLIVRHLLVPGHFECCFLPMLEWMGSRLGHPRLSLRGEYLPPSGPVNEEHLKDYLDDQTWQRARTAATEFGMELVD